MARYTETLTVDKPFADTWRAVHAALVANNWNLQNVRDNTFFVKERLGFDTMLWRNASRFALHVRREDDSRTLVYVIGSSFGFGPIPKGRIRRASETMRNQLLAAIAAIPAETP